MNNSPFSAPLTLTIKLSFQKWLLVLLPHLVVLLLALFVDAFTLELKILLIILIAVSLIYYVRLHVFLNLGKSIISIHQDSSGTWMIAPYNKDENREKIGAEVLPSSFVSSGLIVMNCSDYTGSKYSIIFTPDSLCSNEFRRLRVRLKFINDKKK